VPAAIFAIQTYGDQLNWHPHLRSFLADGAWGKRDDAFQPIALVLKTFVPITFRPHYLFFLLPVETHSVPAREKNPYP